MIKRFKSWVESLFSARSEPESDVGPDTISEMGFFVDTNFTPATAAQHLQRADTSAVETIGMTHKKRFDSFDNAQESARKQLAGAYRRAKAEHDRLRDAMVRENLLDKPVEGLGMLEAVLIEMNEYDEYCLRCFMADDNSGTYIMGFFQLTNDNVWVPAFDPIDGKIALVSHGKRPEDAAAALRRKMAPYFPPVQEA